ncbi:MAG: DUF2924 domain-containing protein [Proteobacteria bacterium]|nr:DUF2924 domain-containing protein [Pseudomonadota bacterium]
MYTIEVDFDVFKEITNHRITEDVTPNDVLRELFGLPRTKNENISSQSGGRPWVTKGVSFPNGTEFRATYKGLSYNGVVKDGGLVLNGERFSSPSSAAVSITKNAVNGWIFWECKIPGQDRWILINSLRKT